MTTSTLLKKLSLATAGAGLIALGIGGAAQAATIASSNYSLTAIEGSYAYGQSDWNDVEGTGFVNNTTDLNKVESLLSDGYSYSAPRSTVNGIYNWFPGGFHALEFTFKNGLDHILDSLSFISTRSYSNGTPIAVDYSLDGSSWITAVAKTSGQLGISIGNAKTYTLSLGGVKADRFRFTTNGGDQVSLHEIIVDGKVAQAVPEPTTIFSLLGFGAMGAVSLLKRKRQQKATVKG